MTSKLVVAVGVLVCVLYYTDKVSIVKTTTGFKQFVVAAQIQRTDLSYVDDFRHIPSPAITDKMAQPS